MPDGPRYDDDFYAWTQYQADVLRTLRTRDNRLDRENLVEEVETLGRSERDAVRSQMRRILVHLLKLAYSPARDPRLDWMSSIIQGRAALDDKLSQSLRRDAQEALPKLYSDAREQAAVELQKHGEREPAAALPATCPFSMDQILSKGWYPEPPRPEDG
ncbi:MAG: DUF29 domain-containing protein [Alphaproteobacteria bacterium]|nr:DUF29 domain-containing protein [Alphaproteobacteria bacterium]